MGKGIDMARSVAPEHAAAMDDMKDQLIVVLMKRLADKHGSLALPIAEIDDTGNDLLSFSIDFERRVFNFQLSKKQ